MVKEKKKYARILTIAGSDSGGCAGIQADVKTASACGCFAATAITALTVQNTTGVREVHIPPVGIVVGQIEAVLEDIGADAVKLGMLPTEEIIEGVAATLERFGVSNIVLDPVMVASSGDELISRPAADAIVKRLFPMAALITPNVPEAEYITGCKINSEADFPAAAERLGRLGAHNALLKAGHLEQPDVTDYLFHKSKQVRSFCYERIDTVNTHGTGCSLSAAIASFLAHGYDLEQAVALAEEYIHKAILCGADYSLGKGRGPLHHFYKFWE